MATFDVRVEDYDSAELLAMTAGPDWTLDPARAALLVHDLQPYYLDVLTANVRTRLVAQVERIVDWAAGRRMPVIGSGPRPASVLAQRGLLGQRWGLGPTPDQATATALQGLETDRVRWVRKRSYSAFFATDLAEELRRLGRDQLVVVGVFATAGVLATTYDGFARDIQCFVPLEATADYTKDLHVTALTLISALTGRVTTVSEIVDAGGSPSAPHSLTRPSSSV
ncbi:isochorismatase family protein [Prescottella agglutinans]|uniref:isochorismatase family protein n=1 Tax=Prescottella agglutinans TaxID=1644129 RepID=UPI003D96F662